MPVELTTPQERILRLLGQFSSDLESAWDVPRDLSLPGLSEALGVVRSALNIPLNALESSELITKRMAHVIGAGSRRRNVYHLSEQGRVVVEKLSDRSVKPRKKKSSPFYGQIPLRGEVHGRSQLVDEIAASLSSHHCLILSGLPGIGKSTVASSLCTDLIQQGTTVRWFTMDGFSDLNAMGTEMELGHSLPSDVEALCQLIAQQCQNQVFFIDDVHTLSPRHLDSFTQFLRNMESFNGPKVVLIGREPLNLPAELTRISIPPLEHGDAALLLGDDYSKEERLHIVERLGGHPLAILLHHSEVELPETSQNIQSYVEKVVLSLLDESTKKNLDCMVIVPSPISASKVSDAESIGALDEHALLRWTAEGDRMEVQHLIRNVRRTTLSLEEKTVLHQNAVSHWEEIAESPDDFIHLLFHRIHAQSSHLVEHCNRAVATLASAKSGALSVLLEQAIEVKPNTSLLHYLAAKVALDRCERAHVHRHMDEIEDGPRRDEIKIGLFHLDGRIDEAEAAIEFALSTGTQIEKNKIALSAASRRLDDRLPGSLPAQLTHEVNRYISCIVLPDDSQLREVTLVAVTMVQHSLALIERDFNKAEGLRSTLSSISGFDDALMYGLEAKAALCKAHSADSQLDNALEIAKNALLKQSNSVHRTSLHLSVVEALLDSDMGRAKAEFSQVKLPFDEPSQTHHLRLNARWWYCKSQVETTTALSSLKEASSLHKAAGCPRAAKSVEALMHSML